MLQTHTDPNASAVEAAGDAETAGDAEAVADASRAPYHSSPLRLTSTQLGRGSSAAVYLGYLAGCPVAVKKCSLLTARPAAIAQFRRELHRYQRLRHPCITQFFTAIENPHHLLLVTELMRGGSLFHALSDLRNAGVRALAHPSLLRVAQHVANGLSYLHASHFSFGDLKTMNVLLSEKPCAATASFPPTAQAKLCDFGLSRNLAHLASPHPTAHLRRTHVPADKGPAGTYAYLAPEAFNGLPFADARAAKAADIYALAIVLWELATLQKPWPHLQPLQLIHLVANKRMRPPWPERHHLPPGYVQLVECCWNNDPDCRPSVQFVCAELHRMYQHLWSPEAEVGGRTARPAPPPCNLDDLSEFDAIPVQDDPRELASHDNSHPERNREDPNRHPHLATIQHVESMRLSPHEIMSMCDSMSEMASEVTHASDHNSQHMSRTNSSSFDSNNHGQSLHRATRGHLPHIDGSRHNHGVHLTGSNWHQDEQSDHDLTADEANMEPMLATIKQVQSIRLITEEVINVYDDTTELSSKDTHALDHDNDNHEISCADTSTVLADARMTVQHQPGTTRMTGMSEHNRGYELKHTSPHAHVGMETIHVPTRAAKSYRASGNSKECVRMDTVCSSITRQQSLNLSPKRVEVMYDDTSHETPKLLLVPSHRMEDAHSGFACHTDGMRTPATKRRYDIPTGFANEHEIDQELEVLEQEEQVSVEQLGISLEPRSRFRDL